MVQLKIGNTVLKNNLILGPMAGVTFTELVVAINDALRAAGRRHGMHGNGQRQRYLLPQ